MANNFEIILPASSFVPDSNAQLVAGDGAAAFKAHLGRPVLAMDDTDEEAATSVGFQMPATYTGSGTLKADVWYYMASDATNDVAIDVFVEAVTHGDTLDLEAASGWDSANSGTASVSGTTAGDPRKLTITLANKDSVAAGDLVRIGIRRDCDSANDDASGDLYFAGMTIREET